MSDAKWFSAKLQFAVMIEPEGSDLLNDCVFLFKADDFEPAFERAIEIGEARQHGLPEHLRTARHMEIQERNLP